MKWGTKRTVWMRIFSVAACSVAMIATSQAEVIITGGDAGSFPSSGQVFTVNPFTAAAQANRGLAGTRRIRQTFKNETTFDVGEILISFDVTGGSVADSANDTGLAVRVFEVDDVLASSWTPGDLVREFVITDTLPSSTEYLSFQLTGSDRFSLPARFDGTTGYGLEISTPDSLSTDGNPGVWYFTNDAAVTDPYPDGGYYRDGSGAAGSLEASRRDLGLVIRAVPEPSTVCLVLLGVTALATVSRRRNNRR